MSILFAKAPDLGCLGSGACYKAAVAALANHKSDSAIQSKSLSYMQHSQTLAQ